MADDIAPTVQSAPSRPGATVGGNRLELIEGGEERLRAILELIAGAQHSVRLLFYMFNPDWAGRLVRDALVEAAKRGVSVKLLIDGYGSTAEPKFFAGLEAAGGETCVFNPSYGARYLVRNHQKLAIADEHFAIIGGANIDDTYLSDQGPQHWRDLMMSIDGPCVSCAAEYFDALFRWSNRKHARLKSLRRLVGHFSQYRGPVQWKFSGPLSMKNSWWRSVGRDINRGITLEMIFAYFAPPAAMLRRIGRLARRGRARIITASKSDNNATIAAARHSYSRLLRRHVLMYEYQPAKLHTKLVVVDDIVYIGSSNFDYRSLYINLEIMLRVKDVGFAELMRTYFDREAEQSRWITPDLHKRRANPWRRFKWAVSHFLVNIMDYTVTRRLNFRLDR